jgi:NADH dehydrogenase
MKVSVFGGTGFVGGYLIKELIHKGMIPRVLVRNGSESKITSTSEIVTGRIENQNAVTETIDGTEAVIYNIGIIRECLSKGVTFAELHLKGVKSCIKLAHQLGVKRFILMSANGVKLDGTGYQKTKWQAEELLKVSGLEWTIFRPSLIFGYSGDNGNSEFCTQIRDDMLSLPMPAPMFYQGLFPINAGSFSLSPIHVKNVAEFFVTAINQKESIGKVYVLGGPETITWKKIIHQIALASGKPTWKVPIPLILIKAVATLFDSYEWFPVTREQLIMLMEGNTVDKHYFTDFGIEAIPFETDNLIYLKN